MFKKDRLVAWEGETTLLNKKLIFYVEPTYHERVNRVLQENYQRIIRMFEREKLQLVYLPRLLQDVGEEFVMYLTGGRPVSQTASPCEAYRDILPAVVLEAVRYPCLIHYAPKDGGFHIGELEEGRDDAFIIDVFFQVNAYAYSQRYRSYSEEEIFTNVNEFGLESDERIIDFAERRARPKRMSLPSPSRSNNYEPRIEPIERTEEDEESLLADQENKKILNRMRRMARQLEERGFSHELLLRLMRRPTEFLTLKITNGSLVLQGESPQTINLSPLDRAFYMLILAHPEGIDLKCGPDYEEELFGIYKNIPSQSFSMPTRKSVQRLLDPLENRMNTSLSRIKHAFLAVMDDSLAQYYYVSGTKGQRKYVKLNRKYIVKE